MADIFLSYARTEREKAEPIRAALASLGLDVFFDVDGLDGGDVFPDVLDREVKSAGAVVSLWSPHALTRPWIKIESRIGKDRGVLIPVEIGVLDPLHDVPAAFYDDQRIDLVDFNGDTASPGWLKLVKSLARTLERPDLLEREVRSHAHSSAEAADLRAELQALRDQMGELAAAKAAANAQDAARAQAFALIDDSRRVEDYQRFISRYPEGAEAFEAERRIDILQSWSRVAHDDPDAIETWFRESRISVFPALRDEALRMQAAAKKAQRGPNRAPLMLAGLVVMVGVGLGGFALSQSQFWDWWESTPPEAASTVVTSPATDTTLGSGDLYDVVDDGDGLPLNVVSGESTGGESTEPDTAALDDQATLAARAEAVRGLQSALRDLGLYTSVIDGDAGPGTRSAAARFTSDFGGSAPDLETASVPEIEALTGRVEREVVALAGRENAAWAVARQADTVSAYRAYLVNHPTGATVAAANARIRALERDAAAAAWSRARSANTVSAYETYLRDYPGGANASDARTRIASLTTPTFRTGQTFRDTQSGGGQGPEMVVVPAGSFRMGSTESEAGRDDDEGPQRTVRINYQFAVGKYEVTWAEWEACVADRGCSNSGPDSAGGDEGWGKGNRPVIEVDWNDAQAYVQWLSRKTGEEYRLLSEAEWEYVARAGTRTRFSWGDGDPTCSRGASNGANFGSCTSDRTEPVGFSAANAFGLHDLHGNVWEWVEDCYASSYSGAPTDGSARIVSACSRRVLRGGSWKGNPRYLRSADRGRSYPTFRSGSWGFRVARTL